MGTYYQPITTYYPLRLPLHEQIKLAIGHLCRTENMIMTNVFRVAGSKVLPISIEAVDGLLIVIIILSLLL